jgi:hypothetical protein
MQIDLFLGWDSCSFPALRSWVVAKGLAIRGADEPDG